MAQRTPFNASLALSNDPAEANRSLVEQAGGYEGEAAKIGGIKTAESITAIGKAATGAYVGWKEAEQQKAITDTIERTYNPETGYKGAKVDDIRKAQNNNAVALGTEVAVWDTVFDKAYQGAGLTPEAVAELNASEEKMRSIKDAETQGVLSPERARAEISKHVRASIAALPGLADEFRKQASALTHGADVFETERLLKMSERKSVSQIQAEEDEKWVVKMTDDATKMGALSKYGIKDYRDAAAHIRNRSDVGSKLVADVQLATMNMKATEERGAVLKNRDMSSKESVDAWLSKTDTMRVSAEGMRVQESSKRLAARLGGRDPATLSVADLNNPAVQAALMEERLLIAESSKKSLEGDLYAFDKEVDIARRSGVPITSDDVVKGREQLTKRIDAAQKRAASTPEDALNYFKAYSVQAGQTIKNALDAGQAQELMMKFAFGPQFLDAAKTQGGMASLKEQYKGNEAAQSFISIIEGRQKGLPQDIAMLNKWANTTQHANGLFNPNAPAPDKAAADYLKQQTTSPDKDVAAAAKKELQDVTQLAKDGGKKALAGPIFSDSAAANAFAYGASYTPSEIDDMRTKIMSGRHEDAFRNDTSKLKVFEKAVGERTERWLSPVDSMSIPQRINTVLKNIQKSIPDMYIGTGKEGLVVATKDGSKTYAGGRMYSGDIQELQRTVSEANKMLDIMEKLGVDRGVRTAKLLADVGGNLGLPNTAAHSKQTSSGKITPLVEIRTREDALAALTAGTITGANYDAILRDMAK